MLSSNPVYLSVNSCALRPSYGFFGGQELLLVTISGAVIITLSVTLLMEKYFPQFFFWLSREPRDAFECNSSSEEGREEREMPLSR